MRTVFGDIQASLLDRERHRENSGRVAFQFYVYETTGTGELVTPEPLMFDTPFFYRPFFSYGHEIIRAPQRDIFMLPVSSGGILRWVQDPDDRDWYIGAFMYFRVTRDLQPEQTSQDLHSPVVQHHFTFLHDSYKVLSGSVHDELENDSLPLLPPTAVDGSE